MKKKAPFFAKFLENQVSESQAVKGGATTKHPSDKDDLHVTMKYPSDGDDHAVR